MVLDYKSSLSRYRKYVALVRQQPLWQASLVLILSLGLLIILLVSVLRPTLITISSLLGQITSQRQIDRQLDAKIAATQRAQFLLTSIAPRLVSLDASLPATPSLGLWTQAVETLASGSGVVITDIALSHIPLSPPATASALTQINFEVVAKGSYPQLIDFIDTLEKLPRLAVINLVQFNRQHDGGLDLAVEGTISFIPN